MPYKGGVQLLPETQRRPTLRSYTSGNALFYAAVVIGIGTFVVSAILGGYKKNLQGKLDTIEAQLDASEANRDRDQEKELVAVAKQSSIMKQLLNSKLYWTQALSRMEQMAQSSVTLTAMQADATKSTITFRATADSYASVARQIAAFTAATGIDDIAINSIKSTPSGRIEFNGVLSINAKSMLTKPIATPTP